MFSLLGRVKVVIDQVESYVSTGIGFLSWKNRFDPMGIDSVKFSNSSGDGESAPKSSIQLVGEDTIEFGSTLPSHRRQWLAASLQEIFSPKDTSKDSRPSWLKSTTGR
jgi:hypothetical protein